MLTITGSGVTRIREHMVRAEKGGEVAACMSIGQQEVSEGVALGIQGFKNKQAWMLKLAETVAEPPAKKRKGDADPAESGKLLQACKDSLLRAQAELKAPQETSL